MNPECPPKTNTSTFFFMGYKAEKEWRQKMLQKQKGGRFKR